MGLKYCRENKIIECGPFCNCALNCKNRVTQRPSPHKFCLFKTFGKGWGVKTEDEVKKDSFLFEYTGEYLTNAESETRDYSKYMYQLESTDDNEYTIDASEKGSLARFVNHSCKPNSQIYWVNDCRQLPENA